MFGKHLLNINQINQCFDTPRLDAISRWQLEAAGATGGGGVGNNVRRQRIGGRFIDLFLFKILFTIYRFQPLIFRAYVRFREGICFFCWFQVEFVCLIFLHLEK